MRILKTNLIEIEAKEKSTPEIKIPINLPNFSLSCSCSSITANDTYVLKLKPLEEVKYMVSDLSEKNYYYKTITVKINDELLTVKIKVTT